MNIMQKHYNRIYLNTVLDPYSLFDILCTLVLLLLIKYYFYAQVCLACCMLKILVKSKHMIRQTCFEDKHTVKTNTYHFDLMYI